MKLSELHDIIQLTMDWEDYHLHQFIINDKHYAGPETETGEDIIDDRKTSLSKVVEGEKFKLLYEYDFGDNWQINLTVEKVLPVQEGIEYPVCLAGKRAGPPEDCGGVFGYYEMLEAIKDPDNPDHEDMIEWVGDEYDPESFDVEEINHAISA